MARLCVLLLLVLLSCEPQGGPTPEALQGIQHVVGTVRSTAGQRSLTCSGTLLTPQLVLTAAHCVDQTTQVSFVIDGRAIAVTRHLVHPRFTRRETRDNFDIALLTLAEPVARRLFPILGGERHELDGDLLVVGRARTGGEGLLVSLARAEQLDQRWIGYLAHGAVCAGDSGGPTFALRGGRLIVTGVHSRGDCGSLALDMRVAGFRSWIGRWANPDSDGDGVPDGDDRCSATEPGRAVWRHGAFAGCAVGQYRDEDDADRDGVADVLDLCPHTPAKLSVWPSGPYAGCATGERVTLDRLTPR